MKIKEIENGFQVRTNRGKVVRQYAVVSRIILRETKDGQARDRVFIGSEERCLTALLEAKLTERVECKITMV